MSPESRVLRAHRSAVHAAVATIAGILLSGPASVWLVEATHPQPAWQGGRTFVEHWHPIQLAPYLGGLVLVTALVALIASLHALAGDTLQVRSSAALMLGAAFAALIVFNYALQTTYVPALGSGRDDEALIAAFSMANPRSLAWAVEMWGWALLGVATWLLSPIFSGTRIECAARFAFAANGVVSVLGALITIAIPGWVLSSPGLVAFAVWNALLLAMAVLTVLSFRQRLRVKEARVV